MGGYRPPATPKSPYITETGYHLLLKEEKDLWLHRREVVKALSEAAAEGDRSENAEYIYRKKELGQIDRRIRYLQKRIPSLQVINKPPKDSCRIFFGAWVVLENESKEKLKYRIVGPDEFDQNPDYISIDSPVARALLKHAKGDEVSIVTPNGKQSYDILSVHYDQ